MSMKGVVVAATLAAGATLTALTGNAGLANAAPSCQQLRGGTWCHAGPPSTPAAQPPDVQSDPATSPLQQVRPGVTPPGAGQPAPQPQVDPNFAPPPPPPVPENFTPRAPVPENFTPRAPG